MMTFERNIPLASAVALASAVLASPAAASVRDQSVTDESLELLCQQSTLTQAEIDSIQKSELFVDLLEFTLEYCPEIAALLTDGATAVTTSTETAPPRRLELRKI